MNNMICKSTLAAVVASSCLAAAIPGSAAAAYYYEAATTIEGEGMGGGQVSTVRAWVDGDNARVELQEGAAASGFLAPGTYLLTNDAGETMYLVDPEKRSISEIDLAQIFQMVGAITEQMGGLMQMEFADFSSERIAEGPGEPILGFPTTRHQFKTGYTMRIGVLGMSRENRSDTEHDLYCTDAIDEAGFSVWLRPDRFRTGNEDIDRLIEQQFQLECLPLRNRAVTTMTGPRGRESTTTSTTEVTTLREEVAPAETFVLPADFTLTPLVPNLTETEGFPAGGAGDAEEADEPRRRPRLRDLIGR